VKLPYRVGDSFALPLGDGSSVAAYILACGHHVVDIAVIDGNGRAIAALRVSDRALVLQRWRRSGARVRCEPVAPERTQWIGPAHAERIVAARLGIVPLDPPPLLVRELASDTLEPALADLEEQSMLSCPRPLGERALAQLREWLTDHRCARVRVCDGATLIALAGTPIERLTLAGVQGTLPAFPAVADLELLAPADLRAVAAAFPNLRRLRIAARRMRVDASALHEFHALETLDVSGVALESIDALAGLKLRALRLARIDATLDVRALESPTLRTLAIEHARDLRGVAAFETWTALEQLELLGLWQAHLDEVRSLVNLRALVRAEIDLGGRRKNVELNHHANWAYPWPSAER
jgi:hypothetical protein